MPSLLGLNKALFSQIDERRADVALYELHEKDDAIVGSPLAFQYFPETLTDSKAINFQQKEIPGASLPLYQWVSSGERLISFTATFTADVDVIDVPDAREGQFARRNLDIRSAILWLRRFLMPRYLSVRATAGDGSPVTRSRTYPPRKARLYIPNSGIGLAGGGRSSADVSDDAITCVMTQCEVTYNGFFPSGLPQMVEVSLSFAQVPQLGGYVFFPGASEDVDNLVREGGTSETGSEGTTATSIFSYNVKPRFLR